MPADAIRERLAAVVDADALATEPARVRAIAPAVAVAPADADMAAAVLALCSEEGWRVELAGAGTWLDHGRTPERVDVLVRSTRMTGVVEYEPADLTIGVAAGTSLEALRAATAAQRQFLPLDAPAAPVATVGATLATASAGPLAASLGTPRDQALGITVVTGDGRVLRFGGRVVKNVAGYDIVRLLVGSRGTLGLITATFLRLHGMPQSDRTLRLDAGDVGMLLEAFPEVAAVEPGALELVAGGLAGDGWTLLARLRGTADAVEEATLRLQAVLPELNPIEPDEGARVWETLSTAERAARTLVHAHGEPAALRDTLAALAPITGSPLRDGWSIAASATGLVRAVGPEPAGGDAVRAFQEAVTTARRSVPITVPVPPHGGDATFAPWQPDPGLVPLMMRVKAAFDPAGILGVGRYVV